MTVHTLTIPEVKKYFFPALAEILHLFTFKLKEDGELNSSYVHFIFNFNKEVKQLNIVQFNNYEEGIKYIEELTEDERYKFYDSFDSSCRDCPLYNSCPEIENRKEETNIHFILIEDEENIIIGKPQEFYK